VKAVFSVLASLALAVFALSSCGKPSAKSAQSVCGTPLMAAAEKGDLKALEKAIASGAPLDEQDRIGFTALAYACGSRHYDAAELLLKHGAKADFNLRPGDGSSYFKSMVSGWDYRTVGFLLSHGVDPDAKDGFGTTALMLACVDNWEAIGNELRKSRLPEPQYPSASDQIATVKLLLSATKDVNAKTQEGRTALKYALCNKRPSPALIALLKERGAKAD